MKKYVYFFGHGKAEGRAELKGLLGGKGANLAEMTNIGLPVPAGFTISTEVCTYYYANKRTYPKSLATEVKTALKKVERSMGAKFGRQEEPASCVCPLGRPRIDARHDGHHPESGFE